MKIFVNAILPCIFAAIVVIACIVNRVNSHRGKEHSQKAKSPKSADDVCTYDDFVRTYYENSKYYKEVYTDYEKRILFMAITFAIISGFFIFLVLAKDLLNIGFLKPATWIVPAACSTAVFIWLGVYQGKPKVKESFAKTQKKKRKQKMNFIRDSLSKIRINYESKDDMKEFIDFCKEQRDKADLYVSERKFGTFIISAVIIPVLLGAFASICGLKDFNNLKAIVALTVLVIFFSFMIITAVYSLFVSLIEPHINKYKKMYDDLVLDLESFYLFEVNYKK